MKKTQVQVQNPQSWLKYVKGNCDGCWAGCCTLPVEASCFDLIRLGWVTEEEAATLPLSQVARRLQKQGLVRQFQSKTQLFILEQRSGRDCLMLHPETRLCTVYDKRPTVCRTFPKIGPRPGYCPCYSRLGQK